MAVILWFAGVWLAVGLLVMVVVALKWRYHNLAAALLTIPFWPGVVYGIVRFLPVYGDSLVVGSKFGARPVDFDPENLEEPGDSTGGEHERDQ